MNRSSVALIPATRLINKDKVAVQIEVRGWKTMSWRIKAATFFIKVANWAAPFCVEVKNNED